MNTLTIPGIASETIVMGQFVKYASGGWDACDTEGEHADGVAFNDAAAGEALTVQVGGLVTYKCAGTGLADGASVTSSSGGFGLVAAAGDFVRLKAHGAIAANGYAEGIWFSGYEIDNT